ncbi:hypothetical protein RvY_01108 [Ramazzottius varieornatus]|uniref:DUF659 domain-containing protein n=1 Tax=Ramazzottius varieornatus TaxID=947166 RepID=A0A1D1UIQ8_RAMVA|nr:hypothetical protein RvY_01108 [Ramazzottius varieornatus]
MRYRMMLRERALRILRTTATPSLCANPATQRAFVKHDPRSPAFGRKVLNTEMDKVYEQKLVNMKAVLRRTTKISLSTDIWTKRGMSESKLAVTARIYDPLTKTMRRMTLACRTFPSPHTAVRLFKLTMEILTEWEIPPYTISAVVTDNGSNMVAALKALVQSNIPVNLDE